MGLCRCQGVYCNQERQLCGSTIKERHTIVCCRSLTAAYESFSMLLSSLENCAFSPYYFGYALNDASSGFLGLGCWNLRKVFLMYPGMEMSMVHFYKIPVQG